MTSALKIGIDLGTTNSLIAAWEPDGPRLIANALGRCMTPSVVGLDDEGRVIVGEVARERLLTHPELTVSDFKRYMGTDREFTLGKRRFRAEELSALVLRSLLADAAAALGEPIKSAVISVPAYFSDAQRKATKNAGRLAEIEVDRLINEPTAAAVAYGLHEGDDDTTFLIFDIGGGTFDVSVLELFDDVMQVNSSSGDNRLGGEDFVELLMQHALDSVSVKRSALDAKTLAALRAHCETMKRTLSLKHHAEFELKWGKKTLALSLSRTEFETLCQPLLKKLRMPLERALKDASLSGDDLDAVVLVGGASRMPVVRSLVSRMLGQLPRSHINPDEIVALGAAVQAALLAGEQSLKEVVLTDVAPYTLGVAVENDTGFADAGELYHPIIDRNSPIPISRVDRLSNAADFQTSITLKVYQGEGRLVKDNIKLGELTVDVPRARRGEEAVDVRFTYDVSGLLEVECHVLSTEEKKRIVIRGNAATLSDREVEKILGDLSTLKVHPRDNHENALILARGERLYETSVGDMRDYIGALMQRFENVLQGQIPDDIAEAVKEISQIFDEIEKDSPLR